MPDGEKDKNNTKVLDTALAKLNFLLLPMVLKNKIQ